MIKRTLYFGNAAYLKTTNEQMVIEMQDSDEINTVPIEYIGLAIPDQQFFNFKNENKGNYQTN